MLRKILPAILITCIAIFTNQSAFGNDADNGWISLFDGKTLSGWKASENKATFSVQDGVIVVDGPRSHLFYTGNVENVNFKDFEFKADIMTKPRANSGMYFHTKYRETGWPSEGYEIQVNNSHSDWRRTGSLYGINDVRNSAAKDNEWFTQHIIVDGSQITV
ncbi:MAG: 3-keto-disaccharide hydrolase, partial [Planctomycetota bacterium]